MRIEPTHKSYPRQSSMRRHQADAVSHGTAGSRGRVANQKPSPSNVSSSKSAAGSDITVVNTGQDDTPRRLSSRRWRSYVPFVAQYIGQETAVETLERYARRHGETVGKAYRKQAAPTQNQRTVTYV